MSGVRRESVLVSFRLDPEIVDTDQFPTRNGVLVLDDRLSAAFSVILQNGAMFASDTMIPEAYTELIVGSMVRSPECGHTVRDYFQSMARGDWDLCRSVCDKDVRLSCVEHQVEAHNYERTVAHHKLWRSAFESVEFKFPYVSIGTEFAVINYDYQITGAKAISKPCTNWVYFQFNSDRKITRIKHLQPEEIISGIGKLTQNPA
jgi:hypothetical protein